MLPLHVLLLFFLSTKSILYLPSLDQCFWETPVQLNVQRVMGLSIIKYVWKHEIKQHEINIFIPRILTMLTNINFELSKEKCIMQYFLLKNFFFGGVFLGPHPQPMKVPRLEVEWELQPQPLRIRAASATYTIAHGNARFSTHRARPGIKPTSSWILVRFSTTEPQRELLKNFF